MLYIQQSLGPDEELVHVGEFHWTYTFHAFMAIIWGAIISFVVIYAGYYAYQQMGKLPMSMSVFDSIQYLHPGIRGFSFLMFVLGLLSFTRLMVTKATTEIAVTNTRLVLKKGLVARSVVEMSVDRIEGVNVLQSFLGRLLNYGRLMVRGMGVGEVMLPPIQDPVIFRKAIEKAKSMERGKQAKL